MSYFGFIGITLILLGWIYETYLTIKTKKVSLPLNFVLIYGAGTVLLTIHSWILNDLIFLILNIAATIIAIINIYFIFKARKKKG